MTGRPEALAVLAAADVRQLHRRAHSELRCRRRHLLAFTVATPHGLLLLWADKPVRRHGDWLGRDGWRAEWTDRVADWSALVLGCGCERPHPLRRTELDMLTRP